MNLVFHQLKKDLLRTRIVLVLWIVLQLLQFALIGWSARPGDVLMQSLYPMLSGLLTFFNYLLVLVLVPLLIHQEPLVGTTAFWFTRPLSRATVLTSKVYYVLLLVSLPILAQSIVFLANGVTTHDVVLAAPELLLHELSWILIVATLAVLTPNFARFAIVGAIILVVWYLGLFAVQMTMLLLNPQSYISTLASLTASRDLVASLIMIGFGGAVVLLQYLTRRRRLAIALAISSVFVSLLAQYFWPWNFLKPAVHLVQDTEFKADSVGASLVKPIQTTDQMAIRGGTPLKQVSGEINFKDCPKGYVVDVKNVDPVLKTSDGQKIPLTSSNQLGGYSGNPDPDAIEKALDGVPVLNLDKNYLPPQSLFNLDAETYNRYASTPLNLSVTLECTAYKYVVATELPLSKGARFDRGSEHLIVTDVLNLSNGVDLLLRQRKVRLLFAPQGEDVSPYAQDRSSTVYLLLNKVRHQAVVQKLNTTFNFPMMNESVLVNEPLRISFGPDNNAPRGWLASPLDKAWLANAVLVRLDLTPVATFTRTESIPGFKLDGQFNLPGTVYPSRFADLDTLDQITLPHDATREQVSQYITDILVASRRSNESGQDPQVGMLEKVGAQNVDLLIQMARDNHNYYLNRAVNALAQPDHKDLVIQALATNDDLIDTVVDHGWTSDAKSTILEAFADKNKFHSSKWVVALASLKDPGTYDSLKSYYIEHPSDDVLKALQALPNFDLAGTVDLAWKKAHTSASWQVRDMLPAAAQFGEPDVIDVIINSLKKGKGHNNDYFVQQSRRVLKQYFPVTGATDADLVAWCESNRANLVFDHQTGKFVVHAPAPPPAPPKPVKSGP